MLTTCLTAVWSLLGLPPGFTQASYVHGLHSPTAIEFAPDGRMFVSERCGRVKVKAGPAVITAFTLADCTCAGELGLLGMALSPDFATDGNIFIFHHTHALRARVVRFTMSGNFAVPGSETLIWESTQDCPGTSHHAGCIGFAPDGHLYVSVGEEFESVWSQDLSSQRGKILRMEPDGTPAHDNPYIGVEGADPFVWCVGLRNPFRFSIDAPTGRLFIGDVGNSKWEELDVVSGPSNLGWPLAEGPECNIASCADFIGPVWWYEHGDPLYTPHGDAAIIGGPMYRGAHFPPEYFGSLFVGDFPNGWIKRLEFDEHGHVHDVHDFLDMGEGGPIVDMEVGPDGALYYASFLGPGGETGVFRIEYEGINQAPVAVAAGAPLNGDAPLEVQFTSEGSFDPDDGPDALSFLWAFGDGEISTLPSPSHVFTERGRYRAVLEVNDGRQKVLAEPIFVTVGHAPAPVITAPGEGHLYRAGDIIEFSGEATDVEDGVVPAKDFTWFVDLVHETHSHPFAGPIEGVASGAFTVPSAGHGPHHTHFRIRLMVRDSDGIDTTIERDLVPVISPLSITSDPPGVSMFFDGAPLKTPAAYESLVNFRHFLVAPLTALVGGEEYMFDSWTPLRPRGFQFVAPEDGASFHATYTFVCRVDVNIDGFVSGDDFDIFVVLFEAGDIAADYNRDGFVTGDDYDAYVEAFERGCP